MKEKCAFLILIIISVTFGPCAYAHDLGVVRVSLEEISQGRYSLEVKLPPKPEFESQVPRIPLSFRYIEDPVVIRKPGFILIRYNLGNDKRPLAEEDEIYLPWDREGAFVTVRWKNGYSASRFFKGTQQGIPVSMQPLMSETRMPLETGYHYFFLGIEHILMGWDHLAFVLALCLMAAGWRLVKMVTAFTIGHSATLVLAVLGVVHVPVPPVEALIALSITLVARQALIKGNSFSHSSEHLQIHGTHGAGLVLAFGLLHGLGFASALGNAGIKKSELLLGLFTFNFGVEVGQLLFIAAITGIIMIGRRLPYRSNFRFATAYALGVISFFWFIERILMFKFSVFN